MANRGPVKSIFTNRGDTKHNQSWHRWSPTNLYLVSGTHMGAEEFFSDPAKHAKLYRFGCQTPFCHDAYDSRQLFMAA